MKSNELPLSAQLIKMIVAKWLSKPIYVVAELRIADILAQGSKSIEDLARISNTHAPTLYRIMRALASVGIFSENQDHHFELTPLAANLQTEALRSYALLFNAQWNDHAWEYLLDSVCTGVPAFEKAHGEPLFQWLEKNPAAAKVHNEANAVKAARSHRAIVDAYDFTDIDSLADLGGGLGMLMVEILTANKSLKGIVADLPSLVPLARETIQSRGFSDCCTVVACDFFREIPAGSGAYLMSNILHDWTDEQCTRILKNCHAAMPSNSKLLVVEMIIPPANEPSVAKLLDLEMLVMTGGRERTAEEFKHLLASGGFTLSRIVPTQEGVCIIEGVPI